MKSRAFACKVEEPNLVWLSERVGISISTKGGIDLVDGEIGIELKSRLSDYYVGFAVHHYQYVKFPRANPGKELYWAFMVYNLKLPISSIKSVKHIAKSIQHRKVWIFPWEWVGQFPVYRPKTGPYIYVHAKDFPLDGFKTCKSEGGIFYVNGSPRLEERLIA